MADDLISVVEGIADISALGSDVSSATAATVASRVVSPPGVPGDMAEEQYGDISCAFFRNYDAAIQDNIPSQHLCPMGQEPPCFAVYFNFPNTDGTTTTPTSWQVYKQSALYWFVGSQYEFPAPAQFSLYHPFTRVGIAQNLAWNYVIPV